MEFPLKHCSPLQWILACFTMLVHAKRWPPTCKNSRTFDPNTRRIVSYPDSWQNSKNIFPNNCKMSPASISEIHTEFHHSMVAGWYKLLLWSSVFYHIANRAWFIKRKKKCCHLLRTLLAAATRSYVLASSYMILTRNWPSISSWASLLKTKRSRHSEATANFTAEVNNHCRLLVPTPKDIVNLLVPSWSCSFFFLLESH